MRYEAEAIAGSVLRRLFEDALLRDGAVLGGESARNPGDVVVGDERSERRHEPAGAPLRDSHPRRIPFVADRATIGDDDQLAPRRHG